MYRSFSIAMMLVAALTINQTYGQNETPAAGVGAPPAQAAPQNPADENSLVDKVSFFMGFNLVSNLKSQGEVNVEQLVAGMKAAAAGEDRMDYVRGFQMMSNLKEQGVDLKLERLIAGISAASDGKELGMSPEEVNAYMQQFGKIVQQRQVEKMKKLSDANIAAGEAYMAEVAKNNPDAKMLDGIQYQIIKQGDGPSPTPAQRVKVDYHGTFTDGTVFDSTIKPPSGTPPTPAEFGVVEVVPGFSKVLQTMKVGSTWKVCIPGPQGYGPAGRGKIGPNQALVFEITLLGIVK